MSERARRQDDARSCGNQHLRLAATIIGIVLAICTGTIVHCHAAVTGLEVRVREVEKNDAANAARFEAIRDALKRMEGQS